MCVKCELKCREKKDEIGLDEELYWLINSKSITPSPKLCGSFRNYNLNSAIIIQQRTQFLSWRSWKVARLRPLTSQNVFIQLLISKFLLNVAFPGTCVKTNIQKHIDKIKKIRQLINNSHSAAESKKFSFTFYSIQKKNIRHNCPHQVLSRNIIFGQQKWMSVLKS